MQPKSCFSTCEIDRVEAEWAFVRAFSRPRLEKCLEFVSIVTHIAYLHDLKSSRKPGNAVQKVLPSPLRVKKQKPARQWILGLLKTHPLCAGETKDIAVGPGYQGRLNSEVTFAKRRTFVGTTEKVHGISIEEKGTFGLNRTGTQDDPTTSQRSRNKFRILYTKLLSTKSQSRGFPIL